MLRCITAFREPPLASQLKEKFSRNIVFNGNCVSSFPHNKTFGAWISSTDRQVNPCTAATKKGSGKPPIDANAKDLI